MEHPSPTAEATRSEVESFGTCGGRVCEPSARRLFEKETSAVDSTP